MKRSTDRILTTHVGSLPRPDDLRALILQKQQGQPVDEDAFAARVKTAVAGQRHEEAFMPAVSPSNLANWNRNEHYQTEEEYLYALADALHEEYRAIIDAGLILQVDDPLLASYYVMHPEASVEDCRNWAMGRVEVLNHALS